MRSPNTIKAKEHNTGIFNKVELGWGFFLHAFTLFFTP